MTTETLACAIIGHLVGDYLLQNDWMALNKKAPGFLGFLACYIHASIWAVCVWWFAGWTELGDWDVRLTLFATHFLQDRTQIVAWWMRIKWKDQSRFMQPDKIVVRADGIIDVQVGLGPWSVIVVDNVWHIVTIWAVWRFLA